ncbi:hypothetical protein COHA_001168 [Chlorella ohadii]|uniref:phosphatidylserine decarboxylase n=1 Tax=Chlorella ohadii TaxID=2649997 RepID=A0AAD5DZN2_9CHLO|nr:hypothetical protein COHA_001168 [Chlorella ohadii]
MGLLQRAKRLASRLLGRGGAATDRKEGGNRVVRLARLPTRVFADGSFARGVAVEGLYGLTRLTVHEAELSLDSGRDPNAGSTESVAHPYNNRTKYYAVLSVGRQTFASKKVRRAGERPSSADLLPGNSGTVALSGGSATAGVAKSGGSATAAVATSGGSATAGPAKSGGSGTAGVARSSASGTAAAGGSSTRRRLEDDGVAVFRWEEGTDVVLQRSGATLAQIAVYAAGRIDGALGDKLQCWCTLDLATYFNEASSAASGAAAATDAPATAAAAGTAAAQSGAQLRQPGQQQQGQQQPPSVLLSSGGASSESSELQLSASEESEMQLSGLPHFEQHTLIPMERHPSLASEEQKRELAQHAQQAGQQAAQQAQQAAQQEHQQTGTAAPLLHSCSSRLSRRSLPRAGGGEVLQDVWLPLVDPGNDSKVCGRVRVSVRATSIETLEQQLWRRLLPIVDLNGDGLLTREEFGALLEAIGSELTHEEESELFAAADTNGDGLVGADELAATMTACHGEGEFNRLMKRCPVDGAELLPNDDVANIMYVTLALDEGTGESLRGGYTTPQQVSRSWLLSMTEWATQGLAGTPGALLRGNKYKVGGLRTGAAAAHILIFDRRTKRVVEEAVNPALTLAMRAMYQSRAGKYLLRRGGGLKKLRQMTEKYGAFADSPESAADIPKFLATFRGQVDMKEALLESPSDYKSFNDFFYRKLKPEARPIASPADPSVVVSAADCRLMVYASVDDATRCWIKGRKFSLAGLLADPTVAAAVAPSPESKTDAKGSSSSSMGGSNGEAEAAAAGTLSATAGLAEQFRGGSMAIFRLAPQDYHRFHLPVSCRVLSITDVPGELMTVNPLAVNSPFANVFTRNKRSVLLLDAPGYGQVAYVAIGATVVGSIRWTVEVGQELGKGDECGFFAFGGSTIVVLFQQGAVVWDADLLQNSLSSLETRVLMGERLGVCGNAASSGEA